VVKEYITQENFIENASNEISKRFEKLILQYLSEIQTNNLQTRDFNIFDIPNSKKLARNKISIF